MATSSQETALELSRIIGTHPEIFKGYQKIEKIIEIAQEVLGDVDELFFDVTDDVLTASGAPRVVSLHLYFHNKSSGTLLAVFRINASLGTDAFKIESDNDLTDDEVRGRIELGLERVHQWVVSIVGTVVAEAMLSVESESADVKVAEAFGPIGTIFSARTGKIIEGDFDYSNRDLPVAFSQLTGRPIDNLITGIIRVRHDIWGDAIVSGDEADVLSEFGWESVSEVKML